MEDLRGLIMSYCPNVNKVSAAVILQRQWGSSLPVVDLWGLPDCADEEVNRFWNDGLFIIDIGPNYYKTTGHKSAPESIAKELGFFQSLTPGELKLTELVEAENASRGQLKKWPMSFAWFVRFAYHLPRFAGKEAQIGLIEIFRSAINSFVEGFDAKKTNGNSVRDPRQFAGIFPEEALRVEKCQFAPLTVGRYLRDLWVLGFDEDLIQEQAEFWLSVYDEVKREMESARQILVQDPSPRFRTRNGLDGVILETPSFFLTYMASGNGADIVVAKNPETGHGIIKTQRKNLTDLARKMSQLEPDRWHNDARTGHLVNGGPMYPHTSPTDLTANDLARLVEEYPPQ